MNNQSIYQKIKAKIQSYDDLDLFTVRDFFDYGNPNNIKVILFRLEKEGVIEKVYGGIYHKAVFSKLLGKNTSVDVETVINKLVKKNGWKVVPSGEASLNKLHLSTQVPAKYSYISTGPYRSYNIGRVKVDFKHAASKYIENYSYLTSLVIEAFRTLGEENVNESVYETLCRYLSKEEIKTMKDEAINTSAWIYKKIVELYQYA